jgi:hypothetical protein
MTPWRDSFHLVRQGRYGSRKANQILVLRRNQVYRAFDSTRQAGTQPKDSEHEVGLCHNSEMDLVALLCFYLSYLVGQQLQIGRTLCPA